MTDGHRIGIIGCGYLGRSLYEKFSAPPVSVAAVYDHKAENLAGIPEAHAVSDVRQFLNRAADLDLVVEVAHPNVSRELGAALLAKTGYMPCSVAALADEGLQRRLIEVADRARTRLFVPHGAAVGIDNLVENRGAWEKVVITFRKPPASIDAAEVETGDQVVLFEGSARDIAEEFPRSVNAMVACALATVGLDRTTTRFVADRTIGNVLKGEFEFFGKDGSRLTIIKQEPAVGITSTGMVNSITGSILRALGTDRPGLRFV
jgi:aspartate dehydrogenase